MTTPTLADEDMQQTAGAPQTVTAAGMTAWLDSVSGYKVSRKKRLFQATELELIQTARRDRPTAG